MKIIDHRKYINVGWYSSKTNAQLHGAVIVKRENPNYSVRVIPERGAKHTVNANKNGYAIYRSVKAIK
jgi:hypothetical protein